MMLWYLARAAGFGTLVLATLTIVLGAWASSRRALDRRVLHQLTHRSAGVLTLALLTLHVVLLVTDRYVDLSLSGALVPFTGGYRPVAVGLGTLAMFGLLATAATGALRGRLAASEAGARSWRTVHGAAYVVWLLAMAHGLIAGTDTLTTWAGALYAASGLAVVLAILARLVAAEKHDRAPLPTARKQITVGGAR